MTIDDARDGKNRRTMSRRYSEQGARINDFDIIILILIFLRGQGGHHSLKIKEAKEKLADELNTFGCCNPCGQSVAIPPLHGHQTSPYSLSLLAPPHQTARIR
jgi:hypothetical protein